MTDVIPTEAVAGERIGAAPRIRSAGRHRRFRPGAARRADIAWGYLFLLPAIAWTSCPAPSGPATLNGILHALGLGPAVGRPWLGDFNTALIAVGLIAVWLDFGLCFVLLLAGIQRIAPDIYDAARIDGAGL